MPKLNYIFCVLSAIHYLERRTACLETWAKFDAYPNVDLVFVLGKSGLQAPVREGNLLYCPCPDDYAHLSLKTKWMCHWAVQSLDFDYLFKCDDDTYVAVDRLLKLDSPADYLGCNINGYASGGAGYRLSRRAAETIAQSDIEISSWEDLVIQPILAAANIFFTADNRFHASSSKWPQPTNTSITSHYCSPQRLRDVHAAYLLDP